MLAPQMATSHTRTPAWPGQPPRSKVAFGTAVVLALAALAVAGYHFARDWRRILDLRPVEMRIQAHLPENGGWRSGPLRVASGRQVELTVESVAGTHSFALAHTPVRSRVLAPGEQETLTFVAPEPGRYVLYCTTWCSTNHWRMRTVIEVFDPAAPEAPLQYPQDLPRYQFALEALPLDTHGAETHSAGTGPAEAPNAALGAVLWQALAPTLTPQAVLADLGWPLVSPAEAYTHLRAGHIASLPTAPTLTEREQWALVAYLWQQQTTPETFARGTAIYVENCAACHGPDGQGNGPAAAFSPATEPNFGGADAAARGMPALYYAKIARGGMGTGMPNWGTILSEEDLWAVTQVLYSFMFDYSTQAATQEE